jgi:transcriptional regulator with XRE-family HTH domain
VNNRFKQIREKLNLSQEEMGEAIGITRSGISNIESGKRSVSERHIKLLRSAYNINEHWLRTGKGEMFNPTNTSLDALAEAHNINGLTRAIIEGLITMRPEHQAAFIDLVSTVAAKVRNAEYEQVTAENLAKTMLSDFTSSKAKDVQEPADPSELHTV